MMAVAMSALSFDHSSILLDCSAAPRQQTFEIDALSRRTMQGWQGLDGRGKKLE
jgi:hypothetical protein